jgi:hypothetical protein
MLDGSAKANTESLDGMDVSTEPLDGMVVSTEPLDGMDVSTEPLDGMDVSTLNGSDKANTPRRRDVRERRRW